MTLTKVFALVDCNSFYCSCERLFRPDLKKVPVGVLSNNDGCFVSRTNELKKLGIPMGAPYFQYEDVCKKNNVAVFSANFPLYTNLSERVMMTLSQFAPLMEIYSVDEAFLDLSGLKFDLEDYGREIKRVVERRVGIPVSIGIGATKTLAKVANHVAKKDSQYGGVVSAQGLRAEGILDKVKVEKIWGVGKRSALKLRTLGIRTARQFRDYNNDKQILKMFTKTGRQIQDELRGITCHRLNMEVPSKKEIMSSRTFGSPVFDLKTLRESVANYTSLACEKLRKQNSVCSKVEVWVRTNPFKEVEQYYAWDAQKILGQSADTRKIIQYTFSILDKLYRQGYEYKKASVKLSGLKEKSETQLSFFEKSDSKESEVLMQTMDRINQRYGTGALKSGACGVDNRAWIMRQTLKSARFTLGWSELAIVR